MLKNKLKDILQQREISILRLSAESNITSIALSMPKICPPFICKTLIRFVMS